MKAIPINPPQNSVVQGTGLDFSDEQLPATEELPQEEADDWDDDWELYDLDEL